MLERSPDTRENLAHKELVDRGFMVPMESLDPETVEFIKKAPFRHYYLWRVVNKEDSISTPSD